MKLLVIGGGGREHALGWRLAHCARVSKVFVAPGNGGTAREDGLFNVDVGDISELARFAKLEQVALTVVGPEAPLAQGVVDLFRSEGLRIFGPAKDAARLESSKDFAKAFMARHGIPSAAYATFSDARAAHAYLDRRAAPIVVKADGLAAGKGVVVAQTLQEAHAAVDSMLVAHKLGAAGARIIIEEFLEGEEASFIVMVDGKQALPLATSQDHKRLLDGDQGPNTGGMGAYSPAPVLTPELHARAMREIIQPVIHGMAEEAAPYCGFLYAGLMVTKDKHLKVLEFNCRLGDPETQPMMLRLKSDMFELIEHALDGKLHAVNAAWDRRMALGVVLAAKGYPDAARIGDAISGLPPAGDDYKVFHSGTALKAKQLLTSGGRVLCVTALGDSFKMAQRRAYEIAEQIKFNGCQMRRDIGSRALKNGKLAKTG